MAGSIFRTITNAGSEAAAMSRRSVVMTAAGLFLAVSASPAMAASPKASCVGVGASDMAKNPPPGFRNFGEFTSSSVDFAPDPGVSGYVTFFAHIQPCPL
jgi:hypothetical protein